MARARWRTKLKLVVGNGPNGSAGATRARSAAGGERRGGEVRGRRRNRLLVLGLAALAWTAVGCRGSSEPRSEPTATAPASPATANPDPPATPPPAEVKRWAPVAVVELFTSEGCSSCPPADATLARLLEQRADQPVYGLSFHVDYWNRLGWRDRFSKAAFSDRQRTYARALTGADRVYTPQIVVDGRTEFVGSRADTLDEALKRALATPAEARIELWGKRADASDPRGREAPLMIEYAIESSHPKLDVNLAIVQRDAESRVTRGENAGATLRHANVVRSLRSVEVAQKPPGRSRGRWYTRLPGDLAPDNALLVAYAALPGGRVVGATATSPPPPLATP